MKKTYTFIHGDSGMGKTLMAKEILAARIRLPGSRTVAVDPNAVFDGFGHVVGVEKACSVLNGAPSGGFNIVVRPQWGEKITELWQRVFSAGALLLVVDEAARWAKAGRLDLNLMELFTVGRNRWVDIVTTSQSPMTLHPEIRTLYDVMITFRQSHPKYSRVIARDYFHRPQLAPALERLAPLHYLRATVDGALPTRGSISLPVARG